MYSSDIELKIKHLIDKYKQITANLQLQLKMMYILVFSFILLMDITLCSPQKSIKKKIQQLYIYIKNVKTYNVYTEFERMLTIIDIGIC